MTQDVINQIKDYLAPVADKIGQGAQYGWDVVMKQMIIIGIADAVAALVSLTVLIGAIVLLVEGVKKFEKYSGDEATGVMIFGVFIVGILSLIAFCFFSYEAVAHLINPGFYALQYFIDLVHTR